MTLSEFAQRLRNAAAEIKQQAPTLVRTTAMDGMATVERRIKEEGIPGASYKTKAKVPYFQGGAGTGAFKDYGRQKKVDLTLSNRMWNGLSVLGVQQVREGYYQAQVGGTDQEVDNKIIGNMKRYGDFLMPTDEEQKELADDTAAELIDIIKRSIG